MARVLSLDINLLCPGRREPLMENVGGALPRNAGSCRVGCEVAVVRISRAVEPKRDGPFIIKRDKRAVSFSIIFYGFTRSQ